MSNAASPFSLSPAISLRRIMSFDTSDSRAPSGLTRSGASSLRRSGSYLSLTDLQGPCSQPVGIPYASVHRFIDNHEKRFKQSFENPDSSPSTPKPAIYDVHRQRSSSPLAPTPQSLPPRPSFPRSRPEPDLYKLALTTRMRSSQEEQYMRSHFAASILNATRDLEGVVAAQQRDSDGDIIMGDGHVNSSWLVVSSEDWEMADC